MASERIYVSPAGKCHRAAEGRECPLVDKDSAKHKLERQIIAIDSLARGPRFSPEFKKWRRDTEVAIEKIFGTGTRHLEDFTGISYDLAAFVSTTPESRFEERFREGLANARSILQSLIDEVDEYWIDAPTPGQAMNVLGTVERVCDRFHLVARRLRSRYDSRPTLEVEDEYDVQDLLHALLLLDFDDVRREEWTPSYAGGSARMDFLLKPQQTVIEVKKTRKGLEARQIGDELLIDIGRYTVHPDCKTLICFIYDPEGRLGNPRGLETDLGKAHGTLAVRVIIAPKGL